MATGSLSMYMFEDISGAFRPNKPDPKKVRKFRDDVEASVEEQMSSIKHWESGKEERKYKKRVRNEAEKIVRKRTGDFWYQRNGGLYVVHALWWIAVVIFIGVLIHALIL